MRRQLVATTVLLGAAAAGLAAQDVGEWMDNCRHNDWSDARAKVCEERETGFRRAALLRVDPGTNGGVEVIGWDRDSVHVIALIEAWAGSDDDARAIANGIQVVTTDGAIRAEGRETSRHREGWAVSFKVYVPRKQDMDISTQNGPLAVREVSGALTLATQNGPLDLDGVGGDVHARAQNGPLSVQLTGTTWDGAGLDAETTNGPVDLELPDDYNARLETGTVNGPMDVRFPLTVTIEGRVRDRISTTLGKGGPLVRVETTNGPLTIRHR